MILTGNQKYGDWDCSFSSGGGWIDWIRLSTYDSTIPDCSFGCMFQFQGNSTGILSISQNIDIATSGTFNLSLSANYRSSHATTNQHFNVYLNSASPIFTLTTTDSARQDFTTSLSLNPGRYKLILISDLSLNNVTDSGIIFSRIIFRRI